ncbi:hypothetical protein DFH05DRAFT_866230 [Lentinula detonsa]|uniref:Secreted protein n=1 Tax=Lentinula detonsa TaxID=2804962 RepID=A0A9W8U0J3_9AGAR|nr:hypothetical protein DFH05DRAFT_866230 [Lentinula detonsa]
MNCRKGNGRHILLLTHSLPSLTLLPFFFNVSDCCCTWRRFTDRGKLCLYSCSLVKSLGYDGPSSVMGSSGAKQTHSSMQWGDQLCFAFHACTIIYERHRILPKLECMLPA